MHQTSNPMAPELEVSQWFNTAAPLTLAGLRGQIVVLHAFQMLCPSCVSHGLPQAQAVHDRFAKQGVVVIGLHTVFEHHAAMTPVALEAFIHEYRLRFPIGIDQPSAHNPIPRTMAAYEFQGTPSLVVIDQYGSIRSQTFGQVDDMALGALLGQLLAERRQNAEQAADGATDQATNAAVTTVNADACDDQACPAPR
ncbi:MAG: redoxin domain-containing protein [Herbaspirillum sp.]